MTARVVLGIVLSGFGREAAAAAMALLLAVFILSIVLLIVLSVWGKYS